MTQVKAYGVKSSSAPLAPLIIERRTLQPDDVALDILYCGICHSDIHTAKDEWLGTQYPCVPGHEIIGKVTAIGEKVQRFNIGDIAAVGCLVDSCGQCRSCAEGDEQYCEQGFVGTYNGQDPHGGYTYGGYAKAIVVKESFVLKIHHDHKNLANVAPLVCAGITTYSPLKHWKAGPGKKVGIVGLGGLGHMAVKIARAMGAHVVLFTTSKHKMQDGLQLGAHEVCIYGTNEDRTAYTNQLDLIINTVSAPHDLDTFLTLLKKDGTMVLVGAPGTPHSSPSPFNLIFKRRQLAGSLIGGIEETQEMLDFCGKHGIVADIELIPINYLNEAYERIIKADVKYRFVIDMSTL
jgi:uncharacterized zinc-type alcohol dehydrogenase-like protein